MPQLRRRKKPIAEINVVPYIDVMLVLLVIFMITTPLLTQGVKVNLPQAKAQSVTTKNHQPIVVSVDSHGYYYLNIANNPRKPLTPRALKNLVAAELRLDERAHARRAVLVKGDAHVPYGQVVGAMVLLQQAGANNVGLVTEPPPERS